MTKLYKNYSTIAVTTLLFLMTGIILPYEQQHHLRFIAEAGELECIDYDEEENTITVNCSTTFQDVVQAVDDSDILENLGNGEYILKANLEVADGITFEMTSSNGDDGNNLQYLKLAGENGIIVYGEILIDGVKITSWDIADEDVIQQDINGAIHRGYQEFGRRGFDLFEGEGGPSYDMVIRGSKFHHMWFAFYSSGAYNIVADSN